MMDWLWTVIVPWVVFPVFVLAIFFTIRSGWRR